MQLMQCEMQEAPGDPQNRNRTNRQKRRDPGTGVSTVRQLQQTELRGCARAWLHAVGRHVGEMSSYCSVQDCTVQAARVRALLTGTRRQQVYLLSANWCGDPRCESRGAQLADHSV